MQLHGLKKKMSLFTDYIYVYIENLVDFGLCKDHLNRTQQN